MALQQGRDKYIEGLMVCAQAHGEWEQLEELKARLDQVIKRIP